MHTGRATNGDVDLFWIDEGPRDGPVVVLASGAGSTAVMWCRELIVALIDAGFRVLRFDNRDVGRSTRVPADIVYTIADLGKDLAAVLDDADVQTAHLLGRSMGGMTVMSFAATHPARVRTMTLIYTTPCMADAAEHDLPGPQPEILEALAEAAFAPRPVDDDERIERRVAESRLYAGTRHPFDERWAHREAAADVAHAPFAEPGHGAAIMCSESLVPALSILTQPTLILHGTADPIIDIAHGRFLDAALPNSTLMEFDGLGHEMPPRFCAEIVDPVLALMQAAR